MLWPEDVVALDRPLAGSPQAALLSRLARQLQTTLLVGVTEPASTTSFRNEVVAWGPSGHIVGVFEKVHRVPFGEYVPLRSFFSHFADLSGVPVDAVPGHGTGLMRTPAAPLGLLVSFEIFYAGRSHQSVRAGAQLLAVPTNTSSYSTSQVPTQEIAAAIVQAVETGRDLVQAAPTGFSAAVTQRGVVVQRSALGRRQVLFATVALRSGFTPYDHWGDLPVLVLAAAALVAGWARQLRFALLVVAGMDVDAGHARRHVHGVVGRIVLEGQSQVEAVGPQVVHHRLLELGHPGVVPARTHDQQVPAEAVALQPGQRLGLHAVGTPGQQNDGERRIEQLEQAGDLLNHRVVSAGLEEGGPVPPPAAAVQEVLAAGGVGQDPVDVEDDSRPAGCGSGRGGSRSS